MKTIPLLATTLTMALLSVVVHAQTPKAADRPRSPLRQVEFESKFFTIPAEAAARLGLTNFGETSGPAPGGRLRGAAYRKLLTDLSTEKSVKELSAPRVTTKSGQRAVIEIIREFRYPTEFEVVNGDQIGPKAFETRNVGVTLEVEPVVNEDGLIDISARPMIVAFDRFVYYAGGKTRAEGPIPRDGFAQPIFDFSQCSVTATLRAGQALLLGGYEWHGSEEIMLLPGVYKTDAKPEASPAKERRLFFVTLTARLVTPSANAMEIEAGAPVTIATQLAAVTRDRLPEWMIPLASELGKSEVAIDPGKAEEARKALEAATGGAMPARTLEKLGFQLAGVFTAGQTAQLRKVLETTPGGALSTGPVKTIASNERYFVEASGLLRYPASKTAGDAAGQPKAETASVEGLDLQLAVTAQAQSTNTIDLDITPHLITSPKPANDAVTSGGSGGTSAEWKLLKEEPRWSGKKLTTSVTIWSGSTVLFAKASEGRPDRLQILLISATGSHAGEGAAAPGAPEPQPAPAPASAPKLPWAKPVPGKPGFVTSPYALEKGYVDVRGFPTGTEVKCPYSGKSFLVP